MATTKKSRWTTKAGEKSAGVLAKYKQAPQEKGQVYARIPIEKFDRFHKLCEAEGLSMYQAIELSIDKLFDFYEAEAKKQGIKIRF